MVGREHHSVRPREENAATVDTLEALWPRRSSIEVVILIEVENLPATARDYTAITANPIALRRPRTHALGCHRIPSDYVDGVQRWVLVPNASGLARVCWAGLER
jgi:hypothetical protein